MSSLELPRIDVNATPRPKNDFIQLFIYIKLNSALCYFLSLYITRLKSIPWLGGKKIAPFNLPAIDQSSRTSHRVHVFKMKDSLEGHLNYVKLV